MSSAPERLLILAEGFSGDPHYGKTARGVLAYGRRPVVAIVDSTRAGETQGGVPIVGSVEDCGHSGATCDEVDRIERHWRREVVRRCCRSIQQDVIERIVGIEPTASRNFSGQ